METTKTDLAATAVLLIFAADVMFAYAWDAAVRIGWLKAVTISEAIHGQLEGQVSAAFLLGYLVCHLLRG